MDQFAVVFQEPNHLVHFADQVWRHAFDPRVGIVIVHERELQMQERQSLVDKLHRGFGVGVYRLYLIGRQSSALEEWLVYLIHQVKDFVNVHPNVVS